MYLLRIQFLFYNFFIKCIKKFNCQICPLRTNVFEEAKSTPLISVNALMVHCLFLEIKNIHLLRKTVQPFYAFFPFLSGQQSTVFPLS